MFDGGYTDIREISIDMGTVSGGYTDQADGGVGICGGHTDI